MERILEREKNKSIRKRSPNLDAKLELHPLKALVTCTECGRKLGCYASKGNGGIYHYYTCGNKYCSNRMNIRKEIMEHEFEDLIDQMKTPQEYLTILKNKMLEVWEE
ncbi:MAG: zinc ribbon domain-containing protein [Bergeyella sp.]